VFTLRDYSPQDFERLWKLDQECFSPKIAYSPRELRSFINSPRSTTLVAEEEGEIAAFLVASLEKNRLVHIITIDVRAESRCCGIGQALMHEAEKRFKEKNALAIALEVAVDNPAAVKFYAKLGYTVLDRLPRYYQTGVDGLLMGKRLVDKL
jgi:[ribosomal protein S18]-alanine N-acetyltransferase